MEQITGQVAFINKNKFGWYDIKINVDGELVNTRFNLGTKKVPPLEKGDTVELKYETGQYGHDVKSYEKKAVPKPPSNGSAGSGGSFNDNRQQAIHYQSSRKDALALAAMLVDLGILKPTGAKGKQAASLEQYVDKLTVRYFNDLEDGFRILKFVDDDLPYSADTNTPGLPEASDDCPPEED